ncbi:uncharacterized protein LOC131048413 [Cryptomeria japonica]|uniref:uncharacterized protein LOC131048413 n=1 Tax=Cryptomeria japonica TaxID=3369 RepID=UPI0027DA8573|nr:uncharacterized protein LOC131048413 [Cryptomeria japonica]
MSLVDYASSSDEEIEEQQHEEVKEQGPQQSYSDNLTGSLQGQLSEAAENSPTGPITELPDASVLLGSLTGPANLIGNDHSSRVAAAMAASASRKRPETNGSVGPLPYRKLPRQSLSPSRLPSDASGGVLIPPQLRGRSNVVTEDIDKLFVRRKRTEDDRSAPSVAI